MFAVSITPRVKSVTWALSDRPFSTSAATPLTNEPTLSTKDSINNTAMPTTAATIWLADRDDPNKPTANAAAPCNMSPR